jgi:predicted lipid-binding transport protein (Tim44 family)
MKRHFVKICAVMAAVIFLGISVLELNADARLGGGRSFGSRGSRSYSRPATTSPMQSQPRQQYAPSSTPFQQQGGGFMRSMAGGIMGGMLGSMLFGGSAGAGANGAGGGGGIGLFEIALLAGIGYLIYRYIKKKREESASNP